MMTQENFQWLQTMLRNQAGLNIGEDKGYLLKSRLGPLVASQGLQTLDDLVDMVRRGDQRMGKEIIESMVTHETFFFRDTNMYERINDYVIPHFARERADVRTIRIWCAACSHGQEPYSIAMLIHENRHRMPNWRVEILGTDISDSAIARARRGSYSQFEVQRGLSSKRLVSYFHKEGDEWIINDNIKSMVQYRTFNLLKDSSHLGMFDLILLRNVLIYFDADTKKQVLSSVIRRMHSDGILCLGGAETIIGYSEQLKSVPEHRGFYVHKG